MFDLLAIFDPIRDPSAPELSGVTTYKFRVFGGADSTAPPSDRARRRYPALQQYNTVVGASFGGEHGHTVEQ